ncbi:MOSC domain-containing protein [Mucilaginibacter xinganensis]|uniref:MOSC domain-containing protein n=1 Tax=Mucilaginibacter xinganensis TaxID=1234841 RepID=A0A223NXA7_9SPHI|nr:MOSC N-terminal beta barrel domain-containing protein [Mucilaginibacter xinganensis]ASU34507.1 MOSC domain-containing protein [Mucilaginibacter xinganensis]
MLQISELYIYPIKSLAGIKVKNARITPTGFEHDRRWLLIDENNAFLTQREHHQMALLQVTIKNDGLLVTHKINQKSIPVPFNDPSIKYSEVTVSIWDDTCRALLVSNHADKWFTEMLGINCRLVYMPDETKRAVDPRYAPSDAVTSFADAYPFMMIGQASLDDLNNRMPEALPMNRFRPNIVFTGGGPYEEDLYAHFTVGGISFYGVKLCARCVLTTVNQENAKKGKEPLKTLASYRFKNNKILFGQNLVHDGEGEIAVGDEIKVFQKHIEERFFI